jgi:hypothetical protein
MVGVQHFGTGIGARLAMNPESRTEVIGPYSISGFVQYLSDVQVWEPRIVIARIDGAAQEFVVPCGPECYRKNSQEALMAGWAAARQWLDGGRIPWRASAALGPAPK